MKIILVFVCTLFSFLLHAEPADSTCLRLYEKEEISPVQPDQTSFRKFKDDPQYDYYNYQVKDDRSWWDRLVAAFFRWLTKDMHLDVEEKQVNNTFLYAGIALIIVLLFLLYKNRPALFFRDKKRTVDYQVEGETIYGLDFEKLIAEALKNNSFNHAIRWKYLQTLKLLQDKGLIEWNPNKTVNEYVYELKNPALRNLFRDISLLFLYFRYGNFEALEKHYRETESLGDEIKKMSDR